MISEVLIAVFGVMALGSALLVVVLRQPMRAAVQEAVPAQRAVR